jgi:hypothetical protein
MDTQEVKPTMTLAEAEAELSRLYFDRLRREVEQCVTRNVLPKDQAAWDRLGVAALSATMADNPDLVQTFRNLYGLGKGAFTLRGPGPVKVHLEP